MKTYRRMPVSLSIVALLLGFAIFVSAFASPATATNDGGDPTFDTIAALDELTGDHATIFRLYHAFFGRQPDVRGALYWVELHDRCLGLGEIADFFANSEEFNRRYGSVTNEEFIELVYRNVLDRAPDPAGRRYWTSLVANRSLNRGEVMLYVSLSDEFTGQHHYPSDGVPGRACRLASGAPTKRSASIAAIGPVAQVPEAGLTLAAPAVVVERIGFHQSTHPGAQAMQFLGDSTEIAASTMDSRGRDTVSTGAADIAVHPLVSIHAPISGTVARAGGYVLYCRHRDGFVVIKPDARPDLEVKILHIQDVAVAAGDRVEVGDLIASRATPFPFRSQIDDLTAEPSWPHIHLEVVDPSIPRKPSTGSC